MKKLLATSFILLALTLGAPALAPLAHAQLTNQQYGDTSGTSDTSSLTGQSPYSDINTGDFNQGTFDSSGGLSNGTGQSTNAGASNTVTAPVADQPIPPTGDATQKAYNSVMLFIMGIFAWLLGVAALVLDYATYYTVVIMGQYVKDLAAVGLVWSTLRDLGNIVLIFGFIAVGISIILNAERMGYGKKMLPILLVAAIFINFSLFISEAVIDVGNLFATELYSQINGGSLPKISSDGLIIGTDGKTLGTGNNGLSTKIMEQVGLTNIYGQFTPGNSTKGLNDAWPSYISFMAVLLFITTAFVMFSLAFILIARFVTLVLLIMLAPIGFAGLAVPKLSKVANDWWSNLFKQALMAPILLLVLYVALRVITDTRFLTGFNAGSGGNGWLGLTADNAASLAGFAGLTISFLVAMGLLVAVTIVAKNMSATGAGFAMKWGSKLTFGATLGTAGSLGRRTIGSSSHFLAKKVTSSNWAQNHQLVGRATVGLLNKGAKGSFDLRATGAAKSLGGSLSKKAGIDFGTASKMNAVEKEKKAIKGREDYAKSLSLSSGQIERKKEQEADAKLLQNSLTTEKAAYEQQALSMDIQHRADRDPEEQALKKQRKVVEDARIKYDATKDANDKTALDSAEAALRNRFDELNHVKEQQKVVRGELDSAYESGVAGIKKNIASAESAVKAIGNEPQTNYVQALRKNPLGDWILHGPGVEASAKSIEKNLKKDKSDKLIDLLETANKNSSKSSSSTTTPSATPSTH